MTKPTGERVAALETIVPELKEDVREMRADLKALQSGVEDIKMMLLEDIESRASKKELTDTNKRVASLEKKVWGASAVVGFVGFIAGIFGKQFLNGGGGGQP